MVYQFPNQQPRKEDDAIRIRLDLTMDVPAEMAEQFERLGIQEFEVCRFDEDTHCIRASVETTLYRKGA